jgi:hypothetical protein
MVSLLHLADITEEGVTFQSPVDGSSMLLTPEHSMEIQNQLGADIMMALDDVVSSVNVNPERFQEATFRTTRWIDRCIAAHTRPEHQNLFAIVQVLRPSFPASTSILRACPSCRLSCDKLSYVCSQVQCLSNACCTHVSCLSDRALCHDSMATGDDATTDGWRVITWFWLLESSSREQTQIVMSPAPAAYHSTLRVGRS